MMRVRSTVLRLLPGLGLAVLVVSCGGAKRGGFAMPPVPVEVADVSGGPMVDRFRALGTIEAREIVKVVNELNAVVRQMPFTEGQAVAKGALLAQLDDDEIKAEALRAEALRDQAKTNHARVRQLSDQNAASPQELDDASAALKVAEANFEVANVRLQKTRIRSPLSGLVGRRLVSPGTFLRTGEAITEVADVDVVKIAFAAPERYLGQLHKGAEVEVRTTAYPGVTFTGRISVVDPILDPETRTVQLVAEIPNPGRRLRPGLSADVSATLAERAHALTVPDEAVFAQGDSNYVFVVHADSTVGRRAVTLGSRDSSRAEVLQGLSDGDVVVRAGHQKLFDGARVMPLSSASMNGGAPAAAPAGRKGTAS